MTKSPNIMNIRPQFVWKSLKIKSRVGMWRFGRQTALRSAPESPSSLGAVTPLAPLWPKMAIQGVILDPPRVAKWLQNRSFERRSAFGLSKNGVCKVVLKELWKNMKNRCGNRCFLMAQNHVWRYTLCFFQTFAIFETSLKINVKRNAKRLHFWSQNTSWVLKG